MSQFVESIKLLDGRLYNLDYHQLRLNQTRAKSLKLYDILNLDIPVPIQCREGLYKCRVLYDEGIDDIQFTPYKRRNVASLKIVHSRAISYPYKYTDRSALEDLYVQRGNCDDILIVKNRYLTDASASNLVFYDGQRYLTPAYPLLAGTTRQFLLERGQIHEESLTISDLSSFKTVYLINALTALRDIEIPCENICELSIKN